MVFGRRIMRSRMRSFSRTGKNIVDSALSITNTTIRFVVIQAQDNSVLSTIYAVDTGAHIFAVECQLDFAGTDTTLSQQNIDAYFIKSDSDAIPAGTFPAPGTTGSSLLKRLVFQEIGCKILPSSTSKTGTITRFHFMLRIPRIHARFNYGDVLYFVHITNGAAGTGQCKAKFTYRWYI